MQLFLFPLQHVKRPALQNKQVIVLRMAFWAEKVLGTFEKQAPGPKSLQCLSDMKSFILWQMCYSVSSLRIKTS